MKPDTSKNFLIVGLGLLGGCYAKALKKNGYTVNAITKNQADIDYAYEVMDAIALAKKQGKGAIALHGKMIDAPIVARAQRTIDMAKALGLERGV